MRNSKTFVSFGIKYSIEFKNIHQHSATRFFYDIAINFFFSQRNAMKLDGTLYDRMPNSLE